MFGVCAQEQGEVDATMKEWELKYQVRHWKLQNTSPWYLHNMEAEKNYIKVFHVFCVG